MKKRLWFFLAQLGFITQFAQMTCGAPVDEWYFRTSNVPRSPLGFAGLYTVAYGAGRFVASGALNGFMDPVFINSTNGSNWANAQMPQRPPARIRYLNGRFVAVSTAGANVMSSIDGTNWSATRITNGLNRRWQNPRPVGIAFGNNRYVILGITNSNVEAVPDGVAFTSADLVNWSHTKLHAQFMPTDVTFGNGRFVAVGQWWRSSSTPPTNPVTAFVSLDGVQWTPTGMITNLIAITYGQGWFVAAGAGGGYFSTNGFDWTGFPGPLSQCVNLTYANGVFAGVTGYDFIYSTNIINWRTVRISGSDLYPRSDFLLSDVVFGQGTFLAVGGAEAYDFPTIIFQSANLIAPRIDLVTNRLADTLSLDLSGELERVHRLQSSTNLEVWEDEFVYTNNLPTVRMTLPAPAASPNPNKYFRIMALED